MLSRIFPGLVSKKKQSAALLAAMMALNAVFLPVSPYAGRAQANVLTHDTEAIAEAIKTLTEIINVLNTVKDQYKLMLQNIQKVDGETVAKWLGLSEEEYAELKKTYEKYKGIYKDAEETAKMIRDLYGEGYALVEDIQNLGKDIEKDAQIFEAIFQGTFGDIGNMTTGKVSTVQLKVLDLSRLENLHTIYVDQATSVPNILDRSAKILEQKKELQEKMNNTDSANGLLQIDTQMQGLGVEQQALQIERAAIDTSVKAQESYARVAQEANVRGQAEQSKISSANSITSSDAFKNWQPPGSY